MNIAEHLWRTARVYGEQPAIAHGTTVTHDYRRLAERAGRLAAALTARLGLRHGDNVAIVQKNSPHYHETLYGIWWAGLAAVPVNAKLHPKEFGYILENAAARAVFVSAELADAVGEAVAGLARPPEVIVAGGAEYERLMMGEAMPRPVEALDDDLAWIFYTSGTTGRPKGAMLSHLNLLMMTLNYFIDVDRIAPGDAMIHAAPLSHGSGMYALPHVTRAAVNVIPESGQGS